VPDPAPCDTGISNWDPMQMPFVFDQGKEWFVGWTDQLNMPVYTVLSIVGQGKERVCEYSAKDSVEWFWQPSQVKLPDDNDHDLALATLAGPVALSLS